ncbi:MAG: hypothetical protein ACOYEP_07145 [Limnochordia bacterium]|jgi:hypothetical protein
MRPRIGVAVLVVSMVLSMNLLTTATDAVVPQSYDFAQDKIGEHPEGFIISAGAQHGVIEVVEAPEMPSGRALHVLAPPNETKYYVSASTPKLKSPDPKATKLGVELCVKWSQGDAASGNYIYIRTDDAHRLIMLPMRGMLKWHARDAGMNAKDVAVLGRDWHRIRVVADRTTSSATLYIDDMKRPYLENLPFQRPVESWDGVELRFTSETIKTETREIFYGDIKIWVED